MSAREQERRQLLRRTAIALCSLIKRVDIFLPFVLGSLADNRQSQTVLRCGSKENRPVQPIVGIRHLLAICFQYIQSRCVMGNQNTFFLRFPGQCL
jgi:hypothetical protein